MIWFLGWVVWIAGWVLAGITAWLVAGFIVTTLVQFLLHKFCGHDPKTYYGDPEKLKEDGYLKFDGNRKRFANDEQVQAHIRGEFILQQFAWPLVLLVCVCKLVGAFVDRFIVGIDEKTGNFQADLVSGEIFKRLARGKNKDEKDEEIEELKALVKSLTNGKEEAPKKRKKATRRKKSE